MIRYIEKSKNVHTGLKAQPTSSAMSPSSRSPAQERRPGTKRMLAGMAALLLAIFVLASFWTNRDRFLPGRDLDDICTSKKIRVLLAYDPINYFIYKGAPMGYSYELAERFAKELGVQLEVVTVRDIDRQIQMLREGDGDIVAHFMTVTARRSHNVQFSEPLDSTTQMLVQRGQNNGRSPIRNLRELDGRSIHVRRNSAYYGGLAEIERKEGIDIDIVAAQGGTSTSELIGMVDDGTIGLTVADDDIARAHRALYPAIDYQTTLGPPQAVAWAVRKNSPELLRALDRFIEREKRNGNLAVLHQKYYERQYQFRKYARAVFDKAGTISPYDKLVKAGARSIGWDWRMISSIIYEESQFDPEALSWAGAMGLMQLLPTTAAEFGIHDLFNPEANIRAGTAYLETLVREWQEIRDPETRMKFILASYNVGPGHVRDAQKLAVKFGADPERWEGNVERFLLLKSDPRYYNDDAARLGYCNGRMPVRYARNIITRYHIYEQVIPE